jgi:hypothetical protein
LSAVERVWEQAWPQVIEILIRESRTPAPAGMMRVRYI